MLSMWSTTSECTLTSLRCQYRFLTISLRRESCVSWCVDARAAERENDDAAEAIHTSNQRRRVPGGGAAGAGCRAGGICDGEHCGTEPGTERHGTVADAAAADRLQQNRGAGMGH